MTDDTITLDDHGVLGPRDHEAIDLTAFAKRSDTDLSDLEAAGMALGSELEKGWDTTHPLTPVVDEVRSLAKVYARLRERILQGSSSDLASPLHGLAENLYFTDTHVARMRRAFESHRRRRLPGYGDASVREARIVMLARGLVEASRGRLDKRSIGQFFSACQTVRGLDLDELWIIPDMLSLALVTRMVTLAEAMPNRPNAATSSSAHAELDHIVRSLRFIENANWHRLVDGISQCERILASDPSGHYRRMDARTRNDYRLAVVRIARRARRTEAEVAEAAIAQARLGTETLLPGASHVGFHLMGPGLPRLFERVAGRRSRRRLDDLTSPGHYVAAQVVAFVTAAAVFGSLLRLAGGGFGSAWTLAMLLALAMQQMLSSLVAAVFTRGRRRRMPRMDYRQGIPESAATCVVVPCLLENAAVVDHLVVQLRQHHLRNRSPNLHFALLTDFVDAATQHAPGDEDLLARAVDGIAQLNKTYPGSDNTPIFHLLHRPRLWNAVEGSWMGRERKRGKLADFNHFLLEGTATPFSHIEGIFPARRFRYVITLDADTCLPQDTALKLAGVIDHPLNRPVFAGGSPRVERGYTIIQPGIATMMPATGATAFARLFGGRAGLDQYAQRSADVYHDLFGEGSFTGKGIYDIEAFERALAGRLPDNRILSHDLIEGCFARCTVASDIHLLEAYAPNFAVDVDRRLRWMRGDWQVGAWIGRRTPSSTGPTRNDLSLLSRYKILDNILRSLADPAALATLVLASLHSGAAGWLAAGLLSAGLLTPAIWCSTMLLWRRLRDTGKSVAYPGIGSTLLRMPAIAMLRLAFLPRVALAHIGTIVLCAWRLRVSGRHLLAWRTFSQATEGRLRRTGWLPAAVAAVALVAATCLMAPTQLVVAVPYAILWCLAPFVDVWLARRPPIPWTRLDSSDEAFLRMAAQRTWAFFDTHMTADSHWLAPDHFRECPVPTLATRTSPTNIGLGLLAVVAAHDLSLISLKEALLRIGACLRTVNVLPRRAGHLYNWYDTRTLEPLAPHYVSTVDSGNFVGHLMLVRQFLREARQVTPSHSRANDSLMDGIDELIAQCDSLIDADFAFLYDDERALLHLGIRGDSDACDAGHYDMLASEARLAVFVAVARGQLPSEAWYALGRLHTRGRRSTVLLSWSGSMFEYLMPALVMSEMPDSLIAQTLRGAVATQMAEARPGMPWGVSESGYAEHEEDGDYRYQAFGSRSLGLQPDLGRRLVIAPYATAMACVVAPREAATNLRRLAGMGLLSTFGFYEAVDFGTDPSNLTAGKPVREYMAHHQGMALLGFAHALTRGRMRARFEADPELGAARILLDERMPERCEILARPS